MAASAWQLGNKIKEYVGLGAVNFDTDSFYMTLWLSTSNVHDATNDTYASATNQVATNFGYTQGFVAGNLLANPSWTESSGTITFDGDDVVWTASGGSITARYAAIHDDTVTSPVADPKVCSTELDTTPADVTATDGNTFTVQINASGVFTFA